MPVRAWQSPLLQDHPLVGRIYDVRRRTPIAEDELVSRLRDARFVLLGERHDNPDHHMLQARLVNASLFGRRSGVVAFEMFDFGDQPAIDSHFQKSPMDVSGLEAAVGWKDKGWPAWPMYEEIVQGAVERGARIVAANLPRADVMKAAKTATFAVGDETFDVPALPEPLRADLEEEMFHAHCEHLPRNMMGMMATAQVARDAAMARQLLRTDRGQGTVLIAGNGHVRVDRGVPWHLQHQGVTGGIVSVAMIEVRESWTDAFPSDGDPTPYDFVWITPAWERGDPCAEFQGRTREQREQ